MRAELIGHFEPCMTDIYLYIYARMADYIRTHPYAGRYRLFPENLRATLAFLVAWATQTVRPLDYGLFPYNP